MLCENLQDRGTGEVSSVTEIRGSHDVLRIKDLLRKVGHSKMLERLCISARQRRKANHEEVKSGERTHVDGQLAKIRVELTRETETCRDSGHDCRNQVVKIGVGRISDLQSPLVDIVQSLVIDTESFIRIFDKLVERQSGVIRFDNGIRNLGGRHDGKGSHHTVWEFLSDLGQQKRSHTGTGTTSERVRELETLKMVAVFDFSADYVDSLLNELSTFGVMTLGPVVSGASFSGDKVVGAEKLTQGPGADSILRPGF